MVNAEQGVRIAYVELGNAKIELMEPRGRFSGGEIPRAQPARRFASLLLSVDTVAATTDADQGRRACACSARVKAQLNVHGERIAFVHPQGFSGRAGRARRAHASGHRPDEGGTMVRTFLHGVSDVSSVLLASCPRRRERNPDSRIIQAGRSGS
jgi:hypothetical protein